MFKLTLGLTALAVSAAALPTTATAQRHDEYGYGENHDRAYRDAYRDGYNQPLRYAYRDRGYGYADQRAYQYRDQRAYQYRDERAYRRCSDGTTGTIIGAIAGGLLGRAVDDRGDHATGTILGGVGGALAGRAIDRGGANGCSRR